MTTAAPTMAIDAHAKKTAPASYGEGGPCCVALEA